MSHQVDFSQGRRHPILVSSVIRLKYWALTLAGGHR
jgi:hypothetical protein